MLNGAHPHAVPATFTDYVSFVEPLRADDSYAIAAELVLTNETH